MMNTKRSIMGASALTLAVAATLLAPAPAKAAEYWLNARAFNMADPNGGPDSIPMWGYALCTDNFGDCTVAASAPGPALTVPAGDTTLTVHLLNDLAVPTSLVVNGLIKPMAPVWNDGSTGPRGTNLTKRVRSFDAEANSGGGSQVYTWADVKPGTYLYQSGTQPQVQVQMGLYGAVAKNAVDASTTPAEAYPGVAYNNQATLLYSEIDPALHAAVADGTYGTSGPTSTFNYQPKFFLINGNANRVNSVVTPVGGAGTTLLRLLNAGLATHVPMIQGAYWSMVAEDGKPYPYQTRQYTALLSAAKTMDVLMTPDPAGATYPIMDRRLNLSNNGIVEGGMLAYLQFGAIGVAGGGSATGNLPPVANDDTYASVKGVTLNVGSVAGVLANDNNTDGVPVPMRAVAASGATTQGGTYTLNSNGSFSYTPAAAFVGTDTFTYLLTDGQATSNLGTVQIAITVPSEPILSVLDDFNRGVNAVNLGASWSQVAATGANPDVQVANDVAIANDVVLGGLAIYNQTLLTNQAASFDSATPLENAALVLKATGGTAAAPANYVRVRCEAANGGQLVVATTLGGSGISVYVNQVVIAAPDCLFSGKLTAAVDVKGLVTTFLNGAYTGGVQLADVPAWKGNGKIGIQLQTQGGTVDNFSGGTLP